MHWHTDMYQLMWRCCQCIISEKFRRHVLAIAVHKSCYAIVLHSVQKPKLLLRLWLITVNSVLFLTVNSLSTTSSSAQYCVQTAAQKKSRYASFLHGVFFQVATSSLIN